MPSRRVIYKLSAEEMDVVADFCYQLQLPLEVVAKQSLFLAINESMRRAGEMMAQHQQEQSANQGAEEDGNRSGESGTDVEEVPLVSEGTTSNASTNSTDTAADS